ncbi:MAG: RNA methyltransferase [Ferruginibacter sp.]
MLSKTHTKYIQSLLHKKFRDEYNLFIAEGPKVVMDLLESRKFTCKEIFALPDWVSDNTKRLSLLTKTPVTAVVDFELEKISTLTTPHHVLAVFEKRDENTDIQTAGKITLVLDTIQDPGNLGTIIRIADWFGVTDIICSEGCADMYNPKVVQSTMGSLGRVNVVYTNLANWLKENKQVNIYSATLKGKDIATLGKLKEGILIIGNEANGISDEVMQLVNEKITIPKIGKAESLNAAVATGIILALIR